MATSSQKHIAQVEMALTAPNAENLEKKLKQMLDTVEALPESAKKAKGPVGELIGQIKKIQTTLAETGSFNAVINEVKALATSLKTLGTLNKGLELFSNKDLQNINRAAGSIAAAAKAYEQMRKASEIQKGTFGLDSKNITETTRAMKVLEQQLNGVRAALGAMGKVKASDPLYQQQLQIEKNIKSLQGYQGELRRQAEMEARALAMAKQGDVMRGGFFREQERKAAEAKAALDGRNLAAGKVTNYATTDGGRAAFQNKASVQIASVGRFENPDFAAMQIARQKLADAQQETKLLLEQRGLKQQDAGLSQKLADLARQRRMLQAELVKEMAAGNGQSEKALSLTNRIQGLKSKESLIGQQERRSDPDRVKAEEEFRQNQILSRVKGSGGASLLAVQAALIANYAVLNTAMSGIRGAINTSVELEAALKNVQAVTVTTNKDMETLGLKVRELSMNSRFSAVEIANAALVLGQAGLSVRQVSDALPSVITLATAAGTSLAQAVDLTTSIVGVFDKQASDTADVANKVTQAANSSKISVDKLGLALQYTGNAAAQSGISFEETTAALAAMSNAGIKGGSTMGTGLRQFITELQKPSEDFVAALRRVGLSIADVDVRANGLIGVLKTLGAAGFVAGDAIRSFDVRGAAAFNAMIANPADLDRQYEGLLNTQAAIKANEIQMESFQSQALRLQNTLGSLVSTGLAPMQQALTQLMSGLSTVLAPLNAMPQLLQGVTMAAAGFITLGLARHYGAMVPALLPWLGVNKALAASMVGLTGTTLAQVAANTRLALSAGGASVASGTLGTTLTALRVQTALVAATMMTTSGAIGAVRLAVTALAGAIMGMSLGTVALIATVAAVAFSFMDWGDKTEDTKKKIDEAKAAADAAKSSFDETTAKIGSLNKHIDDLYYKQGNLENNTELLKRTTKELTSQFGSLGLQLDANGSSFDTIISKMRGLRGEMQKVARLKLENQLGAEKDVLRTQETDYKERLNAVQSGNVLKDLQAYADRIKLKDSNKLTPAQKATFARGVSGEGLSDASPMGVTALQSALLIARQASPDNQLKYFEERFSGKLSKLLEAGQNISAQKSTIEGVERGLGVIDAGAAFNAERNFSPRPGFNSRGRPVTFEDSYTRPYNVLGEVNRQNPGLPLLPKYLEFQKLTNMEMARIVEIRDQVKSNLKLDETVRAERVTELNKAYEKYRSEGDAEFKVNENTLKNQLKDSVDNLKAQAKGAKGQKLADLKVKIREEEAKFQELGIFGPNEIREARAAARRQIGQTEASNVMARTAVETQGQIDKDLAEKYKREAQVIALQVKGKKIDATNSETVEAAESFIKDGMKLIADEYKVRVLGLQAEQRARGPAVDANDTKIRAGEVAALREQAEEAIDNFVNNAASIFSTIAKKENKAGRRDAKDMLQELKALGSKGQNTLFDQAQELDDIRNLVAQNKLPGGSIAERKAVLAQTQAQIAETMAQLAFYGDETNGYIQVLRQNVEDARAKLAALEERIKNGDVNDRRIAKAQMGAAQSGLETAVGDLSTGLSGQMGLRGQLRTQRADAFAQAQLIPGEQSWDALSVKMEQVLRNYKQIIEEIDTVGDIAKGMEGTLGSLGSSFANFFTSIASGTATVKDAFRSMASSVIKAMLDILAQALAMQAIKAIFGLFNFGGGMATNSVSTGFRPSMGYAQGGKIVGPKKNADSVPIMAMPDEFVIKKSAADVLGDDFLNTLNNVSSGSIQNSSAKMPAASSDKKRGGDVNVYIVPPNQMPSLTPNDVLVTINDALVRNAMTKTLVKTISQGGM